MRNNLPGKDVLHSLLMPMQINKANIYTKLLLISILMAVVHPSMATGIGLPDLGLLGNILVYGGIPTLAFLVIVTIVFFVIKWLFKKGKNKDVTHGEAMVQQLRKSNSFLNELYHENSYFRHFVIFGIPYLLILVFAVYKSIEGNYKLNFFILVEVFMIYAIAYLLPLVLIKFALKIRKDCCDTDKKEK